MALEVEGIMREFETALTDVLQASESDAGTPPKLRSRLARARAAAYKARDAGYDREYSAAVDRAFRTARQNFQ